MGTLFKVKFAIILALLLSILTLVLGCMDMPNFTFSSGETGITAQPPYDIPDADNAICSPSMAGIIDKVSSAIVTIDAEIIYCDATGCQVTEQLAGTGWILEPSGFIVTNNHVVGGAKSVMVTLSNGQIYAAKTVMTDPVNDLAVIDIGESNTGGVSMGDSSKMCVGDPVIALGSALGETKATWGIISSTNSTFVVDTRETLYNMLETSAFIVHGDSGGPLLNMNGEVIGIITGACLTRYGTEVAGYAISSFIAEPIIEQLIRNVYISRMQQEQNGPNTLEAVKTG